MRRSRAKILFVFWGQHKMEYTICDLRFRTWRSSSAGKMCESVKRPDAVFNVHRHSLILHLI